MRPKKMLVLSPCGTSLLTKHVETKEERDVINNNANNKNDKSISKEDRNLLKKIIERAEKSIESGDYKTACDKSAELNGIIRLYENKINSASQDYHILLCTDTYLGEVTARLVERWLNIHKINTYLKRQQDLQTKDIISFQYSLSEIVQWCDEILSDYKEKKYHIVFNLTGGFKSVQGFLQTLGMFYADESVYIFESSENLLRIPRLPVEMGGENVIMSNLKVFRRLSKGLTVSDTNNIPETLLMKMDGETALSPWGDLVWKQFKRNNYSKKVYETPSEKIFYKPEKLEKNLTGDRIHLVNERIDELARHFENISHQGSLKSLDFKKIMGNPLLNSTHEFDAWADKDAKRFFGHFEDNVFVIDQLGKKL